MSDKLAGKYCFIQLIWGREEAPAKNQDKMKQNSNFTEKKADESKHSKVSLRTALSNLPGTPDLATKISGLKIGLLSLICTRVVPENTGGFLCAVTPWSRLSFDI